MNCIFHYISGTDILSYFYKILHFLPGVTFSFSTSHFPKKKNEMQLIFINGLNSADHEEKNGGYNTTAIKNIKHKKDYLNSYI